MLGAIIGDIVGSTRECHNVKTEDFELLPKGSRFTDATVMTLAVAKWLMEDEAHTLNYLICCMQELISLSMTGITYFLRLGRSWNEKPGSSIL